MPYRYDYNLLIEEFLSHAYSVIKVFENTTTRQYGLENSRKARIPQLSIILYKQIRDVYLSGRKHSRAALSFYIFPELGVESKKILVAVDLLIAFLDEAYDEELPRRLRMIVLGTMMAVKPYIYMRIAQNPEIAEILARYMTMPAYVASTQQMKDLNIVEWYYWRGSAMDFFMEMPARLLGYPSHDINPLVEAGRWMRAITLVWKDLRDIEHDSTTDAENPFIEGNISPIDIAEELMNRLTSTRVPDKTRYARIMEISRHYYNNILSSGGAL